MFEKFTESARRVVFFSRYEAAIAGSQTIEPEHLVLGVMRQHKDIKDLYPKIWLCISRINQLGRDGAKAKLGVPPDTKNSILEIPLSPASKEVLILALRRGELGHGHVDPGHIVLALLRQGVQAPSAKIFTDYGLSLEEADKEIPG
jgi:ATP-dependent Clp protease ATP-binding subunit ClpC